LQLQHRTLVPSLHSRELNPHIDFARSPFVVQQDVAPWPRPVIEIGGERREWPRIAGISSFGAGGANAHVIVQEYVAPADAAALAPTVFTAERPALIVMSGRDESRLIERARQLIAAIDRDGLDDRS